MSFAAFKYAENNEKIAFRKIERLQNKIIKLKCNLQFNETCIYIYIYIYINICVLLY